MIFRAIFFNTSTRQIEGDVSDAEALKMLKTLGTVDRMQIYKDGRYITVWSCLELGGWIL